MTQIEPTVSPFLLIFLRSLACSVFLTPVGKLENKQITLSLSLLHPFKILDPTTSIVAIGHICYVMMVVFVCVKALPIVNVAICMNMGPILTVFLAAVLNSEKITWVLIVHVMMAFTGVILIVVGSTIQQTD